MIIHLPKTCSIFTITPDPSTILLGTWTLWQEFRVKGLGWGFWAVVIWLLGDIYRPQKLRTSPHELES